MSLYAAGLWRQTRNNFAWLETEQKFFRWWSRRKILDGGAGAEIWLPVPQK